MPRKRSKTSPPPDPLEQKYQKRRELEDMSMIEFLGRDRGHAAEGNHEGGEWEGQAHYTVNFDPNTLEQLYNHAEQRGVRVAVLIRRAVALWLEQETLSHWKAPSPAKAALLSTDPTAKPLTREDEDLIDNALHQERTRQK
jgi:hypothetical protein